MPRLNDRIMRLAGISTVTTYLVFMPTVSMRLVIALLTWSALYNRRSKVAADWYNTINKQF